MTASPSSGSQPQRSQIRLEYPPNLTAQYVNATLLFQSTSEIIFDFVQILALPNASRARVQSRVVMTPTNAKMLLKALADAIAKYESAHGEIQVPPTLADQLFRSVRLPDSEGPEEQGEQGEAGHE